MSENPYTPPLETVASRRPSAVTWLAILFSLGSMMGGLFLYTMFSTMEETTEFSRERKVPTALFLTVSVVGYALVVVAAVGLWRGWTASWWIACFVLSIAFLSSALLMISAVATRDEGLTAMLLDGRAIGLPLRTLFFAFQLASCVSDTTRNHFGVLHLGKVRVLVTSMLLAISAQIFMALIMFYNRPV